MDIRREMRDGVYFRSSSPAQPKGTLLYLHGLGESGLCFESLLAHPLLSQWRQVAADLPAYGRSEWTPHPLTLAELAEFASRSTPQEAGQPLYLIGHSMGGVIGQYLCESHPQDFRGFVNVEGNLSIEDCTFSAQAARCSQESFVNGAFDELVDRVYEAGLNDPPQRGYYASLRLCDPRAFHLNGLELVTVSETQQLASRLASLPLPTLYIAGLRGRPGSRSIDLLKEAGVRWEGWDDCGHWPFLDRTDRFANRLNEFLIP